MSFGVKFGKCINFIEYDKLYITREENIPKIPYEKYLKPPIKKSIIENNGLFFYFTLPQEDMKLSNFLFNERSNPNYNEIFAYILFQVYFTIVFYFENFRCVHGDLHIDNIVLHFFRENEEWTEKQVMNFSKIYYIFDNKYYVFPNYGFCIKIIDWGKSTLYNDNIFIFSNKNNLKDIFEFSEIIHGKKIEYLTLEDLYQNLIDIFLFNSSLHDFFVNYDPENMNVLHINKFLVSYKTNVKNLFSSEIFTKFLTLEPKKIKNKILFGKINFPQD
jgi:hypothetical protein